MPRADAPSLRDLLQQRNLFLQRELDAFAAALDAAPVSPRLRPFANRLSSLCHSTRASTEETLHNLDLGNDDILEELLSATSVASWLCRLLSQHMAAPVFRASPDDEAALKLIAWMHARHPRTREFAAACATGQASIWPMADITPVYFFPCLETRGLLYLVLLCHEFGHLLYVTGKAEMDALVKELQERVEEFLQPTSFRNDRRSEAAAVKRNAIVDRWYYWAMELFCDAVGLHVGGPAYLHAFSAYTNTLSRGDFCASPEELGRSQHPPSWLRVQLLARRARALGWAAQADTVEEEWRLIAARLGTSEDYHGYFEDSWEPAISEILSDMLCSAGLDSDAPAFGLDAQACLNPWTVGDSPIVLLNQAWQKVRALPATEFSAWEEQVVKEFLAESDGAE